MKIEKISEHHIRFNNGTVIKIAPQSMRIDTTSLSLVSNIKDIDFKETIAFTESAQGRGFSFGNIGGRMIPVSIFGGGASRECAVYYENKLKLVVEVC
jgi:hypothetical protein